MPPNRKLALNKDENRKNYQDNNRQGGRNHCFLTIDILEFELIVLDYKDFESLCQVPNWKIGQIGVNFNISAMQICRIRQSDS